jgi:hypothetical protein
VTTREDAQSRYRHWHKKRSTPPCDPTDKNYRSQISAPVISGDVEANIQALLGLGPKPWYSVASRSHGSPGDGKIIDVPVFR